ncbi:hypothetical protein [Paraburkholderia sp. EG304]
MPFSDHVHVVETGADDAHAPEILDRIISATMRLMARWSFLLDDFVRPLF